MSVKELKNKEQRMNRTEALQCNVSAYTGSWN